MKTIGLMGGMSWESSALYYRLINEGIKEQLGGLHSAKLILNSVDFHDIEQLQHSGDWPGTAEILSDAAQSLENAGADFLLIGTNTMHKVAPQIQQRIDIPLLHIADATAEQLLVDGIQNVGLLGTAFTMEQDFYRGRLESRHGLNVLVPDQDDRSQVHQVIYTELCQGIIRDESKQAYLATVEKLRDAGAEAIILGCTEIGMLIQQSDTDIRLYDTTSIHAAKAVEWALNDL
ncbi:MAG: aspartate/glutamate racemase family protein [Motiliproteus sp.]|nr:aspartate/glutamate racemase family protein [Motiliproteus sp.]MCW9051939.1 aspartate/glutamate racemase family protein [Motiliproteus sp.]